MALVEQMFVGLVVMIVGLLIEYGVFMRYSQKDAQPYIFVSPPPPQNIPMLREIKCVKCKTNNVADNSYCAYCGYELYEFCPKCAYRKPKIETHCVQCGKNPSDLRRMDGRMQDLHAKAWILGALALIVAARTFTISSSVRWINFLSFIVVIPGFIGLGWEALDDIIWLYRTHIWQNRLEWAETTTSKIILSRTILIGIAVLAPLQSAYLFSLLYSWFRWGISQL